MTAEGLRPSWAPGVIHAMHIIHLHKAVCSHIVYRKYCGNVKMSNIMLRGGTYM